MEPYNRSPKSVGTFTITDDLEMMCYLYFPIKTPGSAEWKSNLEPRLQPFEALIQACESFEHGINPSFCADSFYYLTAKHLFVTKDNVANRPGWHTDGFGGDDINYTWCDRFPTIFSKSRFTNIDVDHTVSMHQFDAQALPEDDYSLPENTLTRLDPFVVHRTPKTVTEGMRTFFKLSISKHPYNLKGNSKNPKLSLDWKLHDRSGVRNDPVYHGKDYHPVR